MISSALYKAQGYVQDIKKKLLYRRITIVCGRNAASLHVYRMCYPRLNNLFFYLITETTPHTSMLHPWSDRG
jgi:hypothetical protein